GQVRTARSCEGGGALAYGRKPSLRIGGRPCAAAALSADRRTTRVRAHGRRTAARTAAGRGTGGRPGPPVPRHPPPDRAPVSPDAPPIRAHRHPTWRTTTCTLRQLARHPHTRTP